MKWTVSIVVGWGYFHLEFTAAVVKGQACCLLLYSSVMYDRMDVRCTYVQSCRELLHRTLSETVSIPSSNAVGDLVTGLLFSISRFLESFEMLDYFVALRTKI